MNKIRKHNDFNESMVQRGEHPNKEGRFLDYLDGTSEANRKASYQLLLNTMMVLWHY